MKKLSSLLTVLLLLHIAPARAATPTGFEELSEKLLPTVVNVSTTTKIKMEDRPPLPDMPSMPEFPEGSPFDQFFKDFYDQFRSAPQGEQKTNALGSGFIIDAENGYIVTNNHVINGADEIKIILHDNRTLDATLVGLDDKTDIAVLKVKPTGDLTAAKWGDSDKSKVGSWVIAIGNPFGLGGTVTAGIVSARQRDINAGPYDDFIQTDASINRGNSGGPMFNMDGEVVGVNTAIFSPSGGSVGIGFAAPSNLAKGVVEQLIKYGETKRGWIGVRIQEVTDEIAESLGLGKARGALVASVTPKGPAEEAGMEAGDVILSFDGRDVHAMRHLPRIVADTEIGRQTSVVVWRKGKEKELSIKLGQLEEAEKKGLLEAEAATPGEASPGTKVEPLGLSLAVLDDALRKAYDIPASIKGVVVTDVERDGPSFEKGIAMGDVIVEADQKPVGAPKDVAAAVETAQKDSRSSILLFIARKTDMRFIAVKIEK